MREVKSFSMPRYRDIHLQVTFEIWQDKPYEFISSEERVIAVVGDVIVDEIVSTNGQIENRVP